MRFSRAWNHARGYRALNLVSIHKARFQSSQLFFVCKVNTNTEVWDFSVMTERTRLTSISYLLYGFLFCWSPTTNVHCLPIWRGRVVCFGVSVVQEALLLGLIGVFLAGFCNGYHRIPHLPNECAHHLANICVFSCIFTGLDEIQVKIGKYYEITDSDYALPPNELMIKTNRWMNEWMN